MEISVLRVVSTRTPSQHTFKLQNHRTSSANIQQIAARSHSMNEATSVFKVASELFSWASFSMSDHISLMDVDQTPLSWQKSSISFISIKLLLFNYFRFLLIIEITSLNHDTEISSSFVDNFLHLHSHAHDRDYLFLCNNFRASIFFLLAKRIFFLTQNKTFFAF